MKSLYDDPAWFESGLKGGYGNYDKQTQATLPFVQNLLETNGEHKKNKSVLDIGCGYGTHLELANKLGWECFGIEVSDHARKVAIQRHGDRVYFAESIDELIPHKFDLILLLDIIEHLSDPYRLFYKLFAKGSIGKNTTVVVTTHNAQSKEAIMKGNKWAYLHPPSHLFYYSCFYQCMLQMDHLLFHYYYNQQTANLSKHLEFHYQD